MLIRRRSFMARAAALAGGGVALVVLAAACGSSGSANASPLPSASASVSASPGAAKAAAAVTIGRNWQAFFSGSTPAASKVLLLQDGQRFAKTIQAQAASPISKATSAKVTKVTVTSPTSASVTYSIQQNGQTVLPNQKGTAVLQGGVWKVSAPSFQALLKLEQGQTSPAPSTSP